MSENGPIVDFIDNYNKMCREIDEAEGFEPFERDWPPPPYYVGLPAWEKVKETIVEFLEWAHMMEVTYEAIHLLIERGFGIFIIKDSIDEFLRRLDPNSNAEAAPVDQARQSFTAAEAARVVGIPIVLDLDRDGVETTSLTDGAYFDHDKNGFAELTGWASPDDGLLAWDKNSDGIINDGTELFNDPTTFPGTTNGFQVLAQLDDNLDGKIDSNDAVWGQLKVWQDYEKNKWEMRSEK